MAASEKIDPVEPANDAAIGGDGAGKTTAFQPLGADTITGTDDIKTSADGGKESYQPTTSGANKIFENARAATDNERKMTLMQGIKLYPKAVGWSVLISTCIVMEAYDISLVSNFYAFDQFNRKFGVPDDKGKYQVPAPVSFNPVFIKEKAK